MVGDSSLQIYLGDPRDHLGKKMDLKVYGETADDFTELNPLYNILLVDQNKLNLTYVGKYVIRVVAEYVDQEGLEVTLEKSFILSVKRKSEVQVVPDDPGPAPSPPVTPDDTPYIEDFVGTVYDEIPPINANTWDGTEYEIDRGVPIPYIVSFSATGLLKIGWTDKMVPP